MSTKKEKNNGQASFQGIKSKHCFMVKDKLVVGYRDSLNFSYPQVFTYAPMHGTTFHASPVCADQIKNKQEELKFRNDQGERRSTACNVIGIMFQNTPPTDQRRVTTLFPNLLTICSVDTIVDVWFDGKKKRYYSGKIFEIGEQPDTYSILFHSAKNFGITLDPEHRTNGQELDSEDKDRWNLTDG